MDVWLKLYFVEAKFALIRECLNLEKVMGMFTENVGSRAKMF